MKKTSPLNVLGDFCMKEDTLVIHPNDGFDLGLLRTSYPVYIYFGCSPSDFAAGTGEKLSGKILLENKCRLSTVEMGKKAWEKLGKPKRVELIYSEPNILVLPAAQKVEA